MVGEIARQRRGECEGRNERNYTVLLSWELGLLPNRTRQDGGKLTDWLAAKYAGHESRQIGTQCQSRWTHDVCKQPQIEDRRSIVDDVTILTALSVGVLSLLPR